MATDLESEDPGKSPNDEPLSLSWLKVGMVAAGSAIAGGLAAAWYYRNTLTRLRQAENETVDSDSNTASEISERE
jgi:hypothetical protein